MSPYEIKLLLDIYTIPTWFEGRSESIFSQTVNEFGKDGLIGSYGSLSTVKLTDKGRAHVIHMCNLAYPTEIRVFVDEYGNKIPDTI